MESSSDEEEVRTFVHVLSEKYNPENFPYGQGVVVMPSPPGSPVKGERIWSLCLLVTEDESGKLLNVFKRSLLTNCVCRSPVLAQHTGSERFWDQ